MSESPKNRPDTTETEETAKARRQFLKAAGAAGMAAPAVALLMNAKPTKADPVLSGPEFTLSDIRLKRDVALLSRLDNGLGLYRYQYLWSDETYVGVMAQEVEKVMPSAVTRDTDGYLAVDYTQLGQRLMTLDEWNAAAA